MRKWLYIGLLFGLLCSSASLCAQATASGYCGDRKPNGIGYIVSDSTNVAWTLYTDSVAFVGEGAMGTKRTTASDKASYIKKASFSKDITFIGRYSLSYMNDLEQITVDPENPNYESPDNCNCVIEKENENDKNILLFIGNGFIPEGVEVLRNYALCDNYRLTSVTIPRSVKQMGEKTTHQEVGPNESPFKLSSLKEIHVKWTTEEELPEWLTNKEIENANQITLYVPCGTAEMYKEAAGWKECKAIVEEGCCEIAGGECGHDETDKVHWSFDVCGTLTISGEGRMKSYASTQDRPWKIYTNDIKAIVIEDGITKIGRNAFSGCIQVDSVDIPKSVTTISANAFCIGNWTDFFVHWDEEIPDWPENMTSKTDGITLHVPCGTEVKYGAMEGWQDYKIVADYDETFSVTAKPNDDTMGEVEITDEGMNE